MGDCGYPGCLDVCCGLVLGAGRVGSTKRSALMLWLVRAGFGSGSGRAKRVGGLLAGTAGRRRSGLSGWRTPAGRLAVV